MQSEPRVIPPEVSTAAKHLGRKGGRNGTGEAKVRDPIHYRRMAEIRRVKRLQRMLGK